MSKQVETEQVTPENAELEVNATRNERGMTTAEYAVGTVAAVSFGGVLFKILTDPTLQEYLLQLILWIIKFVTGF